MMQKKRVTNQALPALQKGSSRPPRTPPRATVADSRAAGAAPATVASAPAAGAPAAGATAVLVPRNAAAGATDGIPTEAAASVASISTIRTADAAAFHAAPPHPARPRRPAISAGTGAADGPLAAPPTAGGAGARVPVLETAIAPAGTTTAAVAAPLPPTATPARALGPGLATGTLPLRWHRCRPLQQQPFRRPPRCFLP